MVFGAADAVNEVIQDLTRQRRVLEVEKELNDLAIDAEIVKIKHPPYLFKIRFYNEEDLNLYKLISKSYAEYHNSISLVLTAKI